MSEAILQAPPMRLGRESGDGASFREELLQILLRNRGVADAEAAERFLEPSWKRDIHDPFLLKDMDRAVERTLRAVAGGERIVVWSDYDTDGIPAGVILHDFFKKIGYANFENYIPHRLLEGYGLNSAPFERFCREEVRLLITADCGIADFEEVEAANACGIDVIITDHHLPRPAPSGAGPRSAEAAALAGEGEPRSAEAPAAESLRKDLLPPAHAVVNPKRSDDAYPFDMLCGAGVAWKLVSALAARGREAKLFDIPDGWEKWLLDMAGFATIADMVPLVGENRVLARYGLLVLRKSRRPGLQELLRRAGVPQGTLREDDVGFVVGPRLNAASRMDTPLKAFELLRTKNEPLAGRLAFELDALNERRKGIVAGIVKEAKRRLTKGGLREVIVLGNLDWNPAVLGLAANHLAEAHDRPAFLWGEGGNGALKGSCRGDGRVNVVALMQEAGSVFAGFGGHESSGGFSVARSMLHRLEEALVGAYRGMKKKEKDAAEERQKPEYELSADDVNEETYGVVERLAPFGIGNPRPLFLFENALVSAARQFGKRGNHRLFSLERGSGGLVPAVQFFPGEEERASLPEPGARITFTAHMEKNFFRGRQELRLRIVEII